MVMDLRLMIRFASGRQSQPSAVVLDYAAVELREMSAQWLRRLQAQARQQGAHGGRHAGSLAGRVCDAGCQEVQGFLLGRPMAVAQLSQLF
jgi:hypothetical protein